MNAILKRFILILIASTLTGCVSTYNQGHYENLTKLKAYHLKFLDDHTAAPKKKFSNTQLGVYQAEGDLKFREAEEYVAPLGDDLRVNGLKNVHTLYTRHIAEVAEDRALMPQSYAAQKKEVTEENYNTVINGELSRMGAPAKKK